MPAPVNSFAGPMHENPVLLDPMGQLTGPERTMLRRLDHAGVALKVWRHRKHWLIEGERYTDQALRRFIQLGLARETVTGATIACRLTYTGRLVAEAIRRRPIAGAVPTGDD